jgi:hypothetical protein
LGYGFGCGCASYPIFDAALKEEVGGFNTKFQIQDVQLLNDEAAACCVSENTYSASPFYRTVPVNSLAGHLSQVIEECKSADMDARR